MTSKPETAEFDGIREDGRSDRKDGAAATARVMRKILNKRNPEDELHQLASAYLEGYDDDD